MNEKLKKSVPHIIAIALFLGLTYAYFAPALFENKELYQGDLSNMVGWGKDLRDYHKETGNYAFWSNSMFSGMPANFTFGAPFFNIFRYVAKPLSYLINDGNARILFLYLIGAYIFMLSLGCRPWLSIVGAIAYAFTSYNLIILEAGHPNKGLVMATMAPVIGGIIMCYRKKFFWGSIVTLIFTGLNILWGHQQISYYLLLVILILAITYLIYAIKEKKLKDYFISSGVLLVVAVLALAPESGKLISTADYTKDTMRGGAVLQKNAQGEKESSGLDIDYAYMWSYGKAETMTLLIPNFYGASSHYNIGENSEYYKALRPTGQAKQASKHAPMYWGDQPFTAGPHYAGAIICFFFILGVLILKGPEKWWLLGGTIFSIVLAWGKNFEVINNFLFYHLPLYNKFRTPTMALSIAEITMVAMAMLALKEIFDNKENRKIYIKPLQMSAGITGGLCLLFALFGSSLMSFSGPVDAQFQNYPNILTALVSDRKSMLTSDSWRSFIFIALAAVSLWYYIKNNFKTTYLIAIIGVLIFIDLWTVDKRFLNHDNFVAKGKTYEVVPSEVDKQILQDKDPHYRVLNLTTSTFNESKTAYFHKSIGGYSPAKLRRYQDIIDYHFSKGVNPNVLNMLNGKYVIMPSQQGAQAQLNPSALGNAWFVDEIKWADSPDEEIVALKDFNPAKTAFIDVEWKDKLPNWEVLQNEKASTAFIRLTDYANPGNLFYESSSTKPHLAVFSEVYYKTWRAYIDDKEVPLVRVNYILRGLPVPAGDHKIEFRCIDDVYLRGAKISRISSIIVGIIIVSLLGFALFREWSYNKRNAESKVE